MTGEPIAPKLGALRTVLALLASAAIVLCALVVAAVLAIWISFSSLPAGCGFNSSDACTNPDANNTSAAVAMVVAPSGARVVFAAAIACSVVAWAAILYTVQRAVVDRRRS